jgi:hypothetical protein
MYEVDGDKFTCLSCGDQIVTSKSHKAFCRGFEKKPWIVLAPTKERVEFWKESTDFIEWAKKNRLKLA